MEKFKLSHYELVVVFRDGDPERVLRSGKHYEWNVSGRNEYYYYDSRKIWMNEFNLDLIKNSELLKEDVTFIDLKDNERALVWIDGRFNTVLTTGLHGIFNNAGQISIQIVNIEDPFFENKDSAVVYKNNNDLLDEFIVPEGFEGLYFLKGELIRKMKAGQYFFWKGSSSVRLYKKDLREKVVDVQGQEILTRDNVSIRINAVLSYRLKDVYTSVMFSEDITQSLYREAQLSLRSSVGARTLDQFISSRNEIETELQKYLTSLSNRMGIEITGFGIRDIILPGDMKDLMNKVTEAKKVAEANVISRREEVAAIRSQANTARLIQENPGLMRLKELETMERIASSGKLQIVLAGEKLGDKLMTMV